MKRRRLGPGSVPLPLLAVAALTVLLASRAHAGGPWYVAIGGSDVNDCLGPATPCATINSAIEESEPGDTILVSTGTHLGTGSQAVLLNKDVMLSGGWEPAFTEANGQSIVDGEASRRGLWITEDVVAIVDRFTVQNGFKPPRSFPEGAGIVNFGFLTLNDCVVRDNNGGEGGGIGNRNTIVMNRTTVTGHTHDEAIRSGVMILNHSTVTANATNGIRVGGSLELNFSTVSHNGGTGIKNFGGVIRVNQSNIEFNDRGGIDNGTSGDAIVERSLIRGNRTTFLGGGILNFSGNGRFGRMTVVNSTISGNEARAGGGIHNRGALVVVNSTIADNVADGGAGGLDITDTGPQFTSIAMKNSIIANNSPKDCQAGTNRTIPSEGHNLVRSLAGCTFVPAPGDLLGVDPLLGPLADNGGPTLTHALLPGSLAIDHIPVEDCTDDAGDPILVDQRGVPRPQGAACDIGAYESELIQVVIDVKPGNDLNPINPMGRGVIPVAILGSDTFDVADVDVTTLAFGPNGAGLAHQNGPHVKDANNDGLDDLLAHFFTEDSGIAFGDEEACVTGELLDGTPFEGCDAIATEPPCGRGFEAGLLLLPMLWVRRRLRH